ncbi:MAG TPA: DUF3426 domain-containing protein [Beijerinckiaceae bacterium]|nr:DUF3426 domain-containing protein [Beijerinckiaceae bacterium]
MLLIKCPACAASYELPESSFGPEGRKVRCTACRTLWLARPAGSEEPAEPAAEAIEETEGATPVPQMMPVERPRPWHQRIRPAGQTSSFRRPLVIVAALAACLVVAVGLRKSIVERLPDLGRVYAAFGLPVNLSGLALRQIKGGLVQEGNVELLVVQGEIVNVSPLPRPVPRLKFALMDAKGHEIYSWTAQPDTKDLQPGTMQSFRRRLASPPPEAVEVLVRFASKDDLLALAN